MANDQITTFRLDQTLTCDGYDGLLICRLILGQISLKLSNMSVCDLCKTHCQQVTEFSQALVFHTYKVPPVPINMVKSRLCIFGYCFSGVREQGRKLVSIENILKLRE